MSKRIIISGGGTGGHVFPAISIANALKSIDSDIDILFVGAEGKLEMTKVPEAGYSIKGLPVAGFARKLSLKNFVVVVKLMRSLVKARKIISGFKPHVVVGVGGYASGPVLRIAAKKGIPTLIQEQNSYAGLTNKLLAKKAVVICVAYEGMEKYFPAHKILFTGNPVRKDLMDIKGREKEAYKYFGLSGEGPVVLVLGGSGGSRTVNHSIAASLDEFRKENIQVVWQTGKYYYKEMKQVSGEKKPGNIKVHAFIDRMDLAYAAADIIVSRAGAGTVSELSLAGKPVILIPSPNVAEDHQTKNAMALVRDEAAVMINDNEALEKLSREIISLVKDKSKCASLAENIKLRAMPDSDIKIANEVLKLAE
ncbi:MAG: undecaprenyldiphospho-muramoylpentapeptide beta-N-acetylglucosaminyltransferase [Bacteroidales bacterium]|nr:undecaprenyldiphospho-muramoylpentapeptide beta-N-acetylglucosaminyltransferase [Bacteroidales bacterium]